MSRTSPSLRFGLAGGVVLSIILVAVGLLQLRLVHASPCFMSSPNSCLVCGPTQTCEDVRCTGPGQLTCPGGTKNVGLSGYGTTVPGCVGTPTGYWQCNEIGTNWCVQTHACAGPCVYSDKWGAKVCQNTNPGGMCGRSIMALAKWGCPTH